MKIKFLIIHLIINIFLISHNNSSELSVTIFAGLIKYFCQSYTDSKNVTFEGENFISIGFPEIFDAYIFNINITKSYSIYWINDSNGVMACPNQPYNNTQSSGSTLCISGICPITFTYTITTNMKTADNSYTLIDRINNNKGIVEIPGAVAINNELYFVELNNTLCDSMMLEVVYNNYIYKSCFNNMSSLFSYNSYGDDAWERIYMVNCRSCNISTCSQCLVSVNGESCQMNLPGTCQTHYTTSVIYTTACQGFQITETDDETIMSSCLSYYPPTQFYGYLFINENAVQLDYSVILSENF
jgi:hypothetical protein